MSETPPSRLPDDLSDFRCEALLGEGAMGVVFRARQKSLNREVALKILRPELAHDERFVERLTREARASAALEHPHLVRAFAVGRDGDRHYIAMELVVGRTADEEARSNPLSAARVVEIGSAIARGLAYGHAKGLVHRDVKPANILLGDDGAIKLTDLGLSKREVDGDATLTTPGATVGTPKYMAPEQIRDASTVGPAGDVYGLAASLVFLGTARAPFSGGTLLEILAAKEAGAARLEGIDPPLAETLRRALDPDPDKRPSAAELAECLEAPAAVAPTRRSGRWRAVGAVGVLLLAFAAAYVVGTRPPATEVASRSPEPTEATALTTGEAAPPLREGGEPTRNEKAILVLPFENLSADPEDAFFAAGVHEDVLSRLVRVPDVAVIARTTAVQMAKRGLTIGELARELDLTHVMEGTVRREGDRVRVTAQLIDAKTETRVWSQSYDRKLDDFFSIQTDVSLAVAERMQIAIEPEVRTRVEEAPTRSLEAERLYLELRGENSPYGTPRAIELAEQLVAIAPDSPSAHGVLASAHAAFAGGDAKVALAAARRSLELDTAGVGYGHLPMGVTLSRWGNKAEAFEHFDQALDLQPSKASVFGIYGGELLRAGRPEEAMLLLRRAIRLEPDATFSYVWLAVASFEAGDDAAAIAVAQRHFERHPDRSYALGLAVWADFARGAPVDAMRRLYDGAVRGIPNFPLFSSLPEYLTLLGAGDAAEEWLARPEEVRRLGYRYDWAKNRVHLHQRRWADAADVSGDWIAASDQDRLYLEAMADFGWAEAARERGDAAEARRKIGSAVARLDEHLALSDGSLLYSVPYYATLSRDIGLLALGERTEEARASLEQLLEDLPRGVVLGSDGSGMVPHLRGVAHALLGDTDAALAEFERARAHGLPRLSWLENLWNHLPADPWGIFGDLPADPRFLAFLDRLREEERELLARLRAEIPGLFDPPKDAPGER